MTITDIKPQAKRPGRYSVFVDGDFAFGLSETALLQTGIHAGKQLEASELVELRSLAGQDKMFNAALRFAAMRPRSVWEIEQYLKRKNAEEHTSYVCERLQRVGLLSDQEFARAWVSNRRLLKSTSKRKLRLELGQKHVPSHIIDEVLQEDDVSDDAVLQQLIAKKRSKYPDQQKLMAYLARQGFGFDDIKRALIELD